jgi:hypothetical protein
MKVWLAFLLSLLASITSVGQDLVVESRKSLLLSGPLEWMRARA